MGEALVIYEEELCDFCGLYHTGDCEESSHEDDCQCAHCWDATESAKDRAFDEACALGYL